jgi:uncharacterized protein
MSDAFFLTAARGLGRAGCASLELLVRPAGAACNLRCSHCGGGARDAQEGARMGEDTLAALVRGACETQGTGEIHFSWRGGEPMLCGLDFFRQALALQRQHAGDRTVRNTLHTNGTLLDDDWADFLADSGFAVTLHIDGPPELHDAHRRDAQARATSQRLLAGVERLKARGIAFHTHTAVSALNARHPLAVYGYLKALGARQMQFVPLVQAQPQCTPEARRVVREVALSPATVGSVAYGRFLTSVFGEWIRHDVGRVFVHLFDSTLQAWVHGRASVCSFAETCACRLAIEHDGTVYACERYLDAEHRVGNLHTHPLPELLAAPGQRAFEEAKRDTLGPQCRRCDVLAACRGGCPRHRFLHAANGGAGENYLCAGYRHFFRTVSPHIRAMAALLRQGRPASDIMRGR